MIVGTGEPWIGGNCFLKMFERSRRVAEDCVQEPNAVLRSRRERVDARGLLQERNATLPVSAFDRFLSPACKIESRLSRKARRVQQNA
jgi:hypothetical protein